jgi:hypothetical protein
MCTRAGGQAFALGALLAALIIGPATAACDDGSGCETTAQSILAGQAAAAEAAEEARLAASDDNKPLPLINNRKSSKPRTAQPARKPAADEAKSEPAKTASDAPVSTDKVKNARAEARDADLRKDSDTKKDAGVALTEAGRAPVPAPTQDQASMPVVSPDEVNEIDEAAAQDAAPTQPPPATVVQQTAPTAPSVTKRVEDMPRLAAARVESAESTTVASATSQESTTWDKTSLIGKIFIALGGLLTAASAIRMFIG